MEAGNAGEEVSTGQWIQQVQMPGPMEAGGRDGREPWGVITSGSVSSDCR